MAVKGKWVSKLKFFGKVCGISVFWRCYNWFHSHLCILAPQLSWFCRQTKTSTQRTLLSKMYQRKCSRFKYSILWAKFLLILFLIFWNDCPSIALWSFRRFNHSWSSPIYVHILFIYVHILPFDNWLPTGILGMVSTGPSTGSSRCAPCHYTLPLVSNSKAWKQAIKWMLAQILLSW